MDFLCPFIFFFRVPSRVLAVNLTVTGSQIGLKSPWISCTMLIDILEHLIDFFR
jgi:hypothetical protein